MAIWRRDADSRWISFLFFFRLFWLDRRETRNSRDPFVNVNHDRSWMDFSCRRRERESETLTSERTRVETQCLVLLLLLCNSLHDSIEPFTSAYPSNPSPHVVSPRKLAQYSDTQSPAPKRKRTFHTTGFALSLCVYTLIDPRTWWTINTHTHRFWLFWL